VAQVVEHETLSSNLFHKEEEEEEKEPTYSVIRNRVNKATDIYKKPY
jgi:hypothetical protein